MKIVTYRPEYREAFVRLNTEWLTRFYWVESFDQYAMDHVEDLIAQGAMAFFALDDDGEVLATCMTMPLEGTTWELCKLAARNQYTGTVQAARFCKLPCTMPRNTVQRRKCSFPAAA